MIIIEELLIISEPWDFESSDGKNRLRINVIEEKKGFIKAEALSNYKKKEGCLLIPKRNEYGHLNITQPSKNEDETFLMIGRFYNCKQ